MGDDERTTLTLLANIQVQMGVVKEAFDSLNMLFSQLLDEVKRQELSKRP